MAHPEQAEFFNRVRTSYPAAFERSRVLEVGSLDTARRFIHVDDIAAGIGAALVRPAGYELLNLTGDALVTLGEIIGESVRLHGRSPAVEERTPGRASVRNIDNARARAALGWQPRIGLRRGLETLQPR